MDELNEYQSQLEEIEAGLKQDPSNTSLKELHGEIVELIGLLKNEHAQTPNPAPPDGNKKQFATGELVLARWVSGDRQFHQARIASVTGTSANPLYTVQFPREKASETVTLDCLRHLNVHAAVSGGAKAGGAKTGGAKVTGSKVTKETDADRALQKHQSKWQSFKSKGAKASRGKPLGERSMFRSPDTLSGRGEWPITRHTNSRGGQLGQAHDGGPGPRKTQV